jgi:hypothetical protein
MQGLAKISDATDRNTALMQVLVSRSMHAQPGATGVMTPSPPPGPLGSSNDSNQTSVGELPMNGRFRLPAPSQHTKIKGPEELTLRVSLISEVMLLH